MRTVFGVIGYVIMLGVLMIGGFLGAAGLLSPSGMAMLLSPSNAARNQIAYGRPARLAAAEPDTSGSVDQKNDKHARSSHTGVAKLRLKATDRELRQSRAWANNQGRMGGASADRHSSNF